MTIIKDRLSNSKHIQIKIEGIRKMMKTTNVQHRKEMESKKQISRRLKIPLKEYTPE